MALLWCPHPNQNFKSNSNPIQHGSKVIGWIGYTIHPIQCLPMACTQWLRVRRPNISQTSFLTLRHGMSQLRCAACCCLQTERRNGRTTAVPKTWNSSPIVLPTNRSRQQFEKFELSTSEHKRIFVKFCRTNTTRITTTRSMGVLVGEFCGLELQ